LTPLTLLDTSLITKYFPQITPEQEAKFAQLGPLYIHWNAQINVISRKDIDSLYEKHVLHSLSIARIVDLKPGTKVLDVGTGGGFPGIPLAILFPEVKFHLVDSIGKKIKVVQAVADALDLKNVRASHMRAEEVKDTYDFVVTRAVTRIAPFWEWVKNKFNTNSTNDIWNGVLALKGGDLNEELAELTIPYRTYSLAEHFEEPFFETKKVVYVAAP
jgi:16S rRNA (guanine527-N7)-methyltransferase